MISPSWLADVFAAIVLAIALFSAVRLVASRGRRRQDEMDADGVHVVMGVAMAGMFVPRLATLPSPLWEAIFAVGAVWFGWRAAQVRRARLAGHPEYATDHAGHLASTAHYCRYPVPHLIDCVAMLYMFWAVRTVAGGTAGGMSAMPAGGARLPVLGLTLALLICGYVVWIGDRFQVLSAAVPAGALTAMPVSAGDLVAASSAASGMLPDGAAPQDAAPSQAAAVAAPAAGGGATAAAIARTVAASLPARPFLAPRAATCCKIAMGVAMGVMLVDLL